MTSTHDARYDHVTCTECGATYQRIDFRGSPHWLMCSKPTEAATSPAFAPRD